MAAAPCSSRGGSFCVDVLLGLLHIIKCKIFVLSKLLRCLLFKKIITQSKRLGQLLELLPQRGNTDQLCWKWKWLELHLELLFFICRAGNYQRQGKSGNLSTLVLLCRLCVPSEMFISDLLQAGAGCFCLESGCNSILEPQHPTWQLSHPAAIVLIAWHSQNFTARCSCAEISLSQVEGGGGKVYLFGFASVSWVWNGKPLKDKSNTHACRGQFNWYSSTKTHKGPM